MMVVLSTDQGMYKGAVDSIEAVRELTPSTCTVVLTNGAVFDVNISKKALVEACMLNID